MSVDGINQTTSLAYATSKVSKDSTTYQAVRSNADDDQKTSSTTNAVTGTTGSRLSAETTAELIKGSQQASTPATETSFPAGIFNGLDDVANDPVYAAKRAETIGTKNELFAWNVADIPKNGDPPSVWATFGRKVVAVQADAEAARSQRESVYNSKLAEGLPPAKIYAELLAFNAAQSEYNARIDHLQGDPVGTRSNFLQAQHDYLKQAIATTNSSEVTG